MKGREEPALLHNRIGNRKDVMRPAVADRMDRILRLTLAASATLCAQQAGEDPTSIDHESRTMIYYRGCLSLLWLKGEIRHRGF